MIHIMPKMLVSPAAIQEATADGIDRLVAPLATLTGDNIDENVRLATSALNEAKALSQSYDAGAARKLIFLICAAGIASLLCSRFVQLYPVAGWLQPASVPFLQKTLIAAGYIAFAGFAIPAAASLLALIHAICLTVNYQSHSRPVAVPMADDTAAKINHIKVCIAETYLFHAKMAEKIRCLIAARRLLQFAMISLAVWVALLASVLIWLPVTLNQ